MIDPLLALIIGATLLTLAAAVFWPHAGLLEKLKTARQQSMRVLVEDALKHLYDCEYRGITCSLESIAGTLGISTVEATKLVSRLEAMQLLTHDGVALKLTGEGRSYALRVIRVHRLWERYLSDETAVTEAEWHREAEKQEHMLTAEQADRLGERLGNPVYDPHGDPIPTSSGTLPAPRGIPLTSVMPGDAAGIVHIEDEPAAVYAQLVAQGLFPGMRVHLMERSADRIVLEAQGNEVILAPVLAANVTVMPLRAAVQEKETFETMADLKPGERGIVTGIASACRGLQRRRLMDLGIVPGTVVRAELTSAGGDPTAYDIRGAKVALRRNHAQQIFVKHLEAR